MESGKQDASVDVQAIPDIMAILCSSAATLARAGDSLTCILTLFKSQTLPHVNSNALPELGSARDLTVRRVTITQSSHSQSANNLPCWLQFCS
jgi:hypothetical protein